MLDFEQLRVVEDRVAAALNESDGPINEIELTRAVQAFLAFDAEDYLDAVGQDYNQRVGAWVHALSHFTRELWQLQQYEHLKMLYREAVKRSDTVCDYGCMDRLLNDYLTYARWFDHPGDYGYGESVPDYEMLHAIRESGEDSNTVQWIAKRRAGLKYPYEQELIRIRLRGFENEAQAWEWQELQRVGWQKDS